MADIFISYKREDRDRIVPLARALQARGYTVWWDLELVPSQRFERQIKRELDAARCVIVAWTESTVGDDGLYVSEWVQIEANSGDQRGILLPVQFDPGRTHWRHGQTQFATLHGWNGDETAQGFIDLLKGVKLHAGGRERPVDREFAAWQAAECAETADAFRQFLTDFPQSRFGEIARGRAFELGEMAAWNALGSAPTIAALAGFLRLYPAGRFADDAEAKIKTLKLASARQIEPKSPPPRTSSEPSEQPPRFRLSSWAFGAGAAVLTLIAALIWQPWRSGESNGAAPMRQTTDASEAADSMLHTPPVETRREADAAPTPSLLRDGQTFRDCDFCPEMVVIPGGSFMMGSLGSEAGRSDHEGPQRRVTIQRFAVGKYEVTRSQWAAFVTATGRADPQMIGIYSCRTWRSPGFAQNDDHPVTCVNWQDARDYAAWLSRVTGQRYRLLTEAEWEYAARAGTTTAYSTGASIAPSQARFNSDSTAAVGSFQPNTFDLYDMHGNVWEWVQDCYGEFHSELSTNGSAHETGGCRDRVFRGGSWYLRSQYLRSAYRDRGDPAHRVNTRGFRLAMTVQVPE